eukprot:9497821-Pyramimonas_sp.AAC.1
MWLVRRWVYCPHELNEEDHIDVLDAIGEAIANREGKTDLHKVKAHADNRGNEKVDSGAKEATRCQTNDRRLKHPNVRNPGLRATEEVYEVRLREPGGEAT